MIIFETKRLRIVRFAEQDRDHFFLLNGNEEIMRYIRPPRTREEADNQFDEIMEAYAADPGSKTGRWAVRGKDPDLFMGSFVIIPVPAEPEKMQLGYSFLPEFWGNGYATEATTGGLAYFLQQTTIPEIYGIAETPNLASQKVLRKAGFQFHGVKTEDGKELQVFILRRGDHDFGRMPV